MLSDAVLRVNVDRPVCSGHGGSGMPNNISILQMNAPARWTGGAAAAVASDRVRAALAGPIQGTPDQSPPAIPSFEMYRGRTEGKVYRGQAALYSRSPLRPIVARTRQKMSRRFQTLHAYVRLAAETSRWGVLAVGWARQGNRREVERCQREWGRLMVEAAGVTVEVIGGDRLVPGRPYVLVANHSSNLDAPVLLGYLPIGCTYVAKKELTRIPLFGHAIVATGAICVDRGSSAVAHRTMDEAALRVQSGQSALVFAEGTRSRDGRLRPFKKGGVVLALKAGVDLVPVTVHGAWAALPRDRLRIRPGPVTLTIHPPIPTAGCNLEDRDDLNRRAWQSVASALPAERIGS